MNKSLWRAYFVYAVVLVAVLMLRMMPLFVFASVLGVIYFSTERQGILAAIIASAVAFFSTMSGMTGGVNLTLWYYSFVLLVGIALDRFFYDKMSRMLYECERELSEFKKRAGSVVLKKVNTTIEDLVRKIDSLKKDLKIEKLTRATVVTYVVRLAESKTVEEAFEVLKKLAFLFDVEVKGFVWRIVIGSERTEGSVGEISAGELWSRKDKDVSGDRMIEREIKIFYVKKGGGVEKAGVVGSSRVDGVKLRKKDGFDKSVISNLFTVVSFQIWKVLETLQAKKKIKKLEVVSKRQLELRKKLETMFASYLSPQLMEKVFKEGLRLGGEKREVTVMFTDVRGFTKLSEALDPTDVVAILNSYFRITSEAIISSDGYLDKYIGDAVMGVFGAPVESATHARDAFIAAVKLLKSLKKLAIQVKNKYGVEFGVGVGINTGIAVVGNIGSERKMEYTCIGDAVNVASRLQGLAGAFEIVISRETYEKLGVLRQKYNFLAVGSVKVKGRDKPVEIYRLKID